MSTAVSETLYDLVRYESHPVPQSHPDRLAVAAVLRGLSPAPLERCRVLELGCGDGSNLWPLAFRHPNSSFTGIDLAAVPLAAGRAIAETLGLANLELLQRDVRDLSDVDGTFDYIIAHGLFSWIPEDARAAVLELCASRLAPQGIAFISYNTYPGWRVKEVRRDLMRFYTRNFTSPAERADQARAIVKFAAENALEVDPAYHAILQDGLQAVSRQRDGSLLHDDLADTNEPLYFTDFVNAARAHGLDYLTDVDYFESQDAFLTPEARRTLAGLAQGDGILREQYLDFLKGRRFRQSLLCRGDAPARREPEAADMERLRFRASARLLDTNGRDVVDTDAAATLLLRNDVMYLSRHTGAVVGSDFTVPRAALLFLHEMYPRSVCFDDLLREALRLAEDPAAPGRRLASIEENRAALADTLHSAYAAAAVQAHLFTLDPPEPGVRPRSSLLARVEVEHRGMVTGPYHEPINLQLNSGPLLLQLLDGDRSFDEVVDAAFAMIRGGKFDLRTPRGLSDDELREMIRRDLQHCLDFGLVV